MAKTETKPIRVLFVGQSGPYSPIALRRLMEDSQHIQLVAVCEGRAKPVAGRTHRWLQFTERKQAARWSQSLRDRAQAYGVPLLQTMDINAPEIAQQLQRLRVDFLICAGFDRLFRRPLLAVPSRGALNAHPSKLPEWRGPAPLFWCLKSGVKQLDMSIHFLDAREDAGPIAIQGHAPWPNAKDGAELYHHAGELAGQLLARWFDAPETERPTPWAQGQGSGPRARRPELKDGLLMPNTMTTAQAERFIRCAPYFVQPCIQQNEILYEITHCLSSGPNETKAHDPKVEQTTMPLPCKDGILQIECGPVIDPLQTMQ